MIELKTLNKALIFILDMGMLSILQLFADIILSLSNEYNLPFVVSTFHPSVDLLVKRMISEHLPDISII